MDYIRINANQAFANGIPSEAQAAVNDILEKFSTESVKFAPMIGPDGNLVVMPVYRKPAADGAASVPNLEKSSNPGTVEDLKKLSEEISAMLDKLSSEATSDVSGDTRAGEVLFILAALLVLLQKAIQKQQETASLAKIASSKALQASYESQASGIESLGGMQAASARWQAIAGAVTLGVSLSTMVVSGFLSLKSYNSSGAKEANAKLDAAKNDLKALNNEIKSTGTDATNKADWKSVLGEIDALENAPDVKDFAAAKADVLNGSKIESKQAYIKGQLDSLKAAKEAGKTDLQNTLEADIKSNEMSLADLKSERADALVKLRQKMKDAKLENTDAYKNLIRLGSPEMKDQLAGKVQVLRKESRDAVEGWLHSGTMRVAEFLEKGAEVSSKAGQMTQGFYESAHKTQEAAYEAARKRSESVSESNRTSKEMADELYKDVKGTQELFLQLQQMQAQSEKTLADHLSA